MATCPACHKESRRLDKRYDLSHRLWRMVGINHFRCAHCDTFFFNFPWNRWRWLWRTQAAIAGLRHRRCPHCGRINTRRSRRRGFAEHLACVVLIQPYRCRTCDRRFFALWR